MLLSFGKSKSTNIFMKKTKAVKKKIVVKKPVKKTVKKSIIESGLTPLFAPNFNEKRASKQLNEVGLELSKAGNVYTVTESQSNILKKQQSPDKFMFRTSFNGVYGIETMEFNNLDELRKEGAKRGVKPDSIVVIQFNVSKGTSSYLRTNEFAFQNKLFDNILCPDGTGTRYVWDWVKRPDCLPPKTVAPQAEIVVDVIPKKPTLWQKLIKLFKS